MKNSLIIYCLILATLPAFAQKLTEKEKAAFDDIAYSRVQPGGYEVIIKWVMPVKYKIYGNPEAYVLKEIDTTMAQIKKLTALAIEKTDDDDEANFIIVIGKAEKDLEILSNDMAKYVNAYGGNIYWPNAKAEIIKAEILIIPESYNDNRGAVRCTIKKSILKSFGFTKSTETAPYSLFYTANNYKLKIDLFDSHIISTFYLPSIKAGATKDKVDEVLAKIN